ncbi:MAG: AAA family ATPase [Actinomycetota bacterium]|nr:AAA family ATPase [Actinomycetota bacterium]
MKGRNDQKFACTACGARHATWLGRCGVCGEWNTIEALREPSGAAGAAPTATALTGVDASKVIRIPTSLEEVDRAMSGGLVAGSTVVIGGEPGIGKSTLALALAAHASRSGLRTLYVSAEESEGQLAERARRLGAGSAGLDVVMTAELAAVLAVLADYSLVVVDSIQALSDPELGGQAGSVNQIRHCAQALNISAKESGATAVILSHVTKDGSLAGPKVLEHLVDAVFVIEGERSDESRALRCLKNRFGKVSEVGFLRMGESGLQDEPDPGAAQLEDRLAGAAGSVMTAMRDGTRARLVEIQALVTPNAREVPKRQFLGLSSQRCSVIIGLIEHFAGVKLDRFDVFMSIAGGHASDDPGLDLAIAAAIVSSALQRPVPADAAVFGELGLTGEVRKVRGEAERSAELRRHGFGRFVAPTGGEGASARRTPVRTLAEALEAMGLSRRHQA